MSSDGIIGSGGIRTSIPIDTVIKREMMEMNFDIQNP
jgi:hypothetical protein